MLDQFLKKNNSSLASLAFRSQVSIKSSAVAFFAEKIMVRSFLQCLQKLLAKMAMSLRDKFHFSKIYRNVNYIGSRAK